MAVYLGTHAVNVFGGGSGEGGGGSPTLQTKSKTYTPTKSQQTEAVTADSGYDGLSAVNVTVDPIPSQYIVPSGNKAITENGTNIDVAEFETVSVDVESGGANIDTKTVTPSDAMATSIQFTDLLGAPKAFFVRCTATLSRSSSYRHYYVATMCFNGTNTTGNRWYRYNGQVSNITSGYSYTYSNGTLTLHSSGNQTTSPGSFINGTYELVYIY